jgi:enoyl-CoA hydratase/carnithine racemase
MKMPNSMTIDRRVGHLQGQGGAVAHDDETFEHITFTADDRVALVTLNRPERLNAFTGRMGDELGRAYARCDADDDIRVVVLTGAGRAFCAGADFERGSATFASPSGAGAREFTASPIRPRAWDVRKPVIAAINGHAIGIGLTIPMQCDIRFVAETARLGFVHVRRGVIPDAHSHWTVPRAAGFAVAAELLLTGREFTGIEAVELGLAGRALPAAEVLPAALELAHDIARNTAPLSVALSKRLLWAGTALEREDVERLETELHRVVMGRDDAREGVLAFVEKRDPVWSLSPTRDWPDDVQL